MPSVRVPCMLRPCQTHISISLCHDLFHHFLSVVLPAALLPFTVYKTSLTVTAASSTTNESLLSRCQYLLYFTPAVCPSTKLSSIASNDKNNNILLTPLDTLLQEAGEVETKVHMRFSHLVSLLNPEYAWVWNIIVVTTVNAGQSCPPAVNCTSLLKC